MNSRIRMTGFTMTVKTESNHLTSVDLKEIQEALFLKRKSLLESRAQHIQKLEYNRSNCSDLIDKASVEEEFRTKLRTQVLEQTLIRDIDNALQNIKNGAFGYCELCGNEIGKKRMQAYPTATYCIECKTTFEMKKGSRMREEFI